MQLRTLVHRNEGVAMTTDADWPAWATDLFATVTACIKFKGLGTLQGAYYPADDRDEPDLIEVAPALDVASTRWQGPPAVPSARTASPTIGSSGS